MEEIDEAHIIHTAFLVVRVLFCFLFLFLFWVLLRVFSGAQEGLALHWRSLSFIDHAYRISITSPLFLLWRIALLPLFFRFSVCVLFLHLFIGITALYTTTWGNRE